MCCAATTTQLPQPAVQRDLGAALAIIEQSAQCTGAAWPGAASPAGVGGLAVLEDQARRHLLPHPVPARLVKPDPVPIALGRGEVRGVR